jgi:hypothetical protein
MKWAFIPIKIIQNPIEIDHKDLIDLRRILVINCLIARSERAKALGQFGGKGSS